MGHKTPTARSAQVPLAAAYFTVVLVFVLFTILAIRHHHSEPRMHYHPKHGRGRTAHDLPSGWMLFTAYVTWFVVARPSYERVLVPAAGTPSVVSVHSTSVESVLSMTLPHGPEVYAASRGDQTHLAGRY
jgi:hypothetical protein